MDKRLEKIRTFKGNVLDFESFIKDKIEQTKKQYAKDKELEKKRINESMSTYKIWNDIEVEKFAKYALKARGTKDDGMHNTGGSVPAKFGIMLHTTFGDLKYGISPDGKMLDIYFTYEYDAQSMYGFKNSKYDVYVEDNIASIYLKK